MRAVNCPIDTSLNFNQAKKLVRDLKPAMIATPKCYTMPPPSATQRTDLQLDIDLPLFKMTKDECLEMPLKSCYEKMTIDPALAMKLKPVELKPGVSLVTLTGKINLKNHKYHLEQQESELGSSSKSAKKQRKMVVNTAAKEKWPEQYLFGKITISTLLQKLATHGISTLKIEEPGHGQYIIHLDKDEALIRIDDQETHVVCDVKSDTRELIRQCIFSCLNSF